MEELFAGMLRICALDALAGYGSAGRKNFARIVNRSRYFILQIGGRI